MRVARLRSFMNRDGDRPRVIAALDTDDRLTGWGECYDHGADQPCRRFSIISPAWLRGRTSRASSSSR